MTKRFYLTFGVSFQLPKLIVVLALFIGISPGCSTLQPVKPIEPSTPEVQLAPVLPQPSYKSFPTETLYSLLTAEIAASRSQYPLTLSNYAQQARVTQDPQIAERATRIAQYLGNTKLALEMSEVWVTVDPQNRAAISSNAIAHLQLGELTEAVDASERLLDEGGEPRFMLIANSATNLNKTERTQLLDKFIALSQQHPNNEQLLLATAILLQQQQQYNEAMTFTRDALKNYPDSIPAAMLEASLLHGLKRDKEAVTKLSQLLEKNPSNTSLRQQYARLLIDYDIALAQEQFAILAQQLPTNGEIILSLGIIAWERKDIDTAHKSFEDLLERNLYVSTAHYYLGVMAEVEKNYSEAIIQYLQVDIGKDFLPATLGLLNIFVQQKDFQSAAEHMQRARQRLPEMSESLYELHAEVLRSHEEFDLANQVLTAGLEEHKTSIRLRYARAMLNHLRQNYTAAERDLRQILAQEPNNLNALNALGYMLADTGSQLEEAQTLLERAIKGKPNDPAILDSIGWLQFRRGQHAKALTNLRKALAGQSSAEISAHLGEVLWTTGKQDEARQVWRKGIEIDPKNAVMRETLKRLEVDL